MDMFIPRAVLSKKPVAKTTTQINERDSTSNSAKSIEKPKAVETEISESFPVENGGSSEEDDDPVLSYSKLQRWPEEGEPVCIICGRYGAYIVDRTDQDVCSLECKARHLHKLGFPLSAEPRRVDSKQENARADSNITCGWDYREVPEVAGMTDVQTEELRTRMRIKVEGGQAPRLLTEFSHLNLPDQLMVNLQTSGYRNLTAVQMQVIPATLYQRDLLVCSATGSGKTLAFLLPIVLHLLRDQRGMSEGGATEDGSVRSPSAVILVPTRELAMQIEDQAKQLMKGLPCMRTALVMGGVPLAHQLYRLRSGVEVVIATPARLYDILEHHDLEVDVSHVQQLVVDEVDCLLHMGFKEQVQSIMKQLPVRRQNLMFSATIPGWVAAMARTMMQDCLTVVVGEPGVLCESVRHTVLWVEEAAKKKKLLSFLQDSVHFRPPAVIFVGSKKGTLLLADTINKSCIARATAVGLHGDMMQQRRTEIVREFLDGRHSVLVATNVLARGVDLQPVHQVFVFDFPSSLLEFIHQVGRAGRMGSPGSAVTFINATSKPLFLSLHDLLTRLGVAVPPEMATSPYLTLQRDERKRRVAESGRDRGTTTPGSKKRKMDSDLLKLLEGSTTK